MLKSTPLRLALAAAVLAIASFLFAGAIAYTSMKRDLVDRLDRQISETFNALQGLYEKDDTADLIAAVARMAQATTEYDLVYGLRSADGRMLAGNLAAFPDVAVHATVDASALGIANEDDLQFRIFTAPIGDMRLATGANLEGSTEILEIALSAFGWAALAVFALAIGGGTLLARQAKRRIDAIAGTMDAIAEGQLDRRIPVSSAGNDLDQLSMKINNALERLKRLVEGMKQVSSDIAHDLKTPINRLCIVIDGLSARGPNGAIKPQDLVEIHEEALKINETFEALLRIAQIESGARRSRFTPTDLRDVVETIFDLYRPDLGDYDLTLTQAEAGATGVIGDRELLVQMVANLVLNAIRYAVPSAKVQLRLIAEEADAGPVLEITDNGPGIPRDEREKVFQRLYRIEKNRGAPGSGLGLTLAKAIAELHWADISLADNGPGLRVTVTFPKAAR